MWFFQLIVFLTSTFLAYISLQYFNKRSKAPRQNTVLKSIKSCEKYTTTIKGLSESRLEDIAAYQLGKKFEVRRQASIGGLKGAREKVDIDLGNGRFGIELKLAKTLRKSNERNRLLGQIDLYLQRKYLPKNILVVIAGKAEKQHDPVILELQTMIKQKNVGFCFLVCG